MPDIIWPDTNDLPSLLTALNGLTSIVPPSSLPTNASNAKAAEVAFIVRCFKSLISKVEELEKRPMARPFSSLFSNTAKRSNDPETRKEEVKLLNAVSHESRELEKRRNNVVVFGMLESEASEATQREQDDLDAIKKVFDAIKVPTSSVVRIHRLKAQTRNNQNAKAPVIVEFRDAEGCDARDTAIKASKELSSKPEFKDIYIRPDLTQAQREQQRELLARRKELNKDIPKRGGRYVGTHYFGIRGNAVVKILIKQQTDPAQPAAH